MFYKISIELCQCYQCKCLGAIMSDYICDLDLTKQWKLFYAMLTGWLITKLMVMVDHKVSRCTIESITVRKAYRVTSIAVYQLSLIDGFFIKSLITAMLHPIPKAILTRYVLGRHHSHTLLIFILTFYFTMLMVTAVEAADVIISVPRSILYF